MSPGFIAIILVAAMNACPCGYADDPEKKCSCSKGVMSKYQHRISGPIHDRIDIHPEVRRVPIAELTLLDSGELSVVIRVRVEADQKIK